MNILKLIQFVTLLVQLLPEVRQLVVAWEEHHGAPLNADMRRVIVKHAVSVVAAAGPTPVSAKQENQPPENSEVKTDAHKS